MHKNVFYRRGSAKMAKKLCALFLTLALALSPLFISLSALFTLPDPYELTFVSALRGKYDRLKATEGEKIVIIGGSSVAFGVRSDIVEQYSGMPTVNFGLYAALGTKLMLDLSRSSVGEGDVIIVTPELDMQTLSLYFNTETTLKAIGNRWDMLMELPMDDRLSLISGAWDYAADKMEYYRLGLSDKAAGRVSPAGVYRADSFNERYDLDFPRAENVMPLYRDINNIINPTPDTVSDEFIDYLNDYTAFCKARGATVYFNFCPINEWGFADGVGKEELSAFYDYLQGELECDILRSPERSVLGAGYFYDTNFHLNDAGAVRYTAELTEDILFELDIPREVGVEIPEEPPLPELDSFTERYDANEVYFTYCELLGGAYAITGLTELGREAKTLTIPVAYKNRLVTVISAGALSGAAAERLIITRDTAVRTIADGAFSDASALRELWIYYPNEDDIIPPDSFFGVAESFTVHVPDGSAYSAGYFWGELGLDFIYDAN